MKNRSVLYRFAQRIPRVSLILVTLTSLATAAVPSVSLSHTISSVLMGWVLLMALLILVAAFFRIHLTNQTAMVIILWAILPAVLRAGAIYAGNWVPALAPLDVIDPMQPYAVVFWLRPLDVFEMITALMLGLFLYHQPGGSATKSVMAAFVMVLAWSWVSHNASWLTSSTSIRNPKIETTLPAAPAIAASSGTVTLTTRPNPAEPKDEERKELLMEKRLQEFRLQDVPTSQVKKKRLKSQTE